jgi:hypothetical protein
MANTAGPTRAVSLAVCDPPSDRGNAVTLEGINPENLPTPQTYTHGVAATGGRLVFIAGQEPEDSQGKVVGLGDLAAQARRRRRGESSTQAEDGSKPPSLTPLLGSMFAAAPEDPAVPRPRDEAFMEPSGRKRWHPVANAAASKTGTSSQNGCRGLRPVGAEMPW